MTRVLTFTPSLISFQPSEGRRQTLATAATVGTAASRYDGWDDADAARHAGHDGAIDTVRRCRLDRPFDGHGCGPAPLCRTEWLPQRSLNFDVSDLGHDPARNPPNTVVPVPVALYTVSM